MTPKYTPADLRSLKTYSLADRPSLVETGNFARRPARGASFREFWNSLPNILTGRDIRAVVDAIIDARRDGRPVILGMGAHVIKCGLGPVIISLMEKGILTAVAMNGAGPIHDTELALVGYTSEDVGPGLKDGTFGMAMETGQFFCNALTAHDAATRGLGRAVGLELLRRNPPYCDWSILANAAKLDIPATVHVAIGTDIIHMRGEIDGALLGAASHTDFRLFCSVVADLSGGVYINAGSSVVLPEVFLKAFSVAQNLGADLHDFTTVNLDFITHYRPTQNVVQRPAAVGGRGIQLNGRHEILIPLIAFAVLEEIGT